MSDINIVGELQVKVIGKDAVKFGIDPEFSNCNGFDDQYTTCLNSEDLKGMLLLLGVDVDGLTKALEDENAKVEDLSKAIESVLLFEAEIEKLVACSQWSGVKRGAV